MHASGSSKFETLPKLNMRNYRSLCAVLVLWYGPLTVSVLSVQQLSWWIRPRNSVV